MGVSLAQAERSGSVANAANGSGKTTTNNKNSNSKGNTATNSGSKQSGGGGSSTGNNNSGNTVKAGADGKAPKGLSTGTVVSTNGGNYRITGVNSDGSYKSEKVTSSGGGSSSSGGSQTSGGGSKPSNTQAGGAYQSSTAQNEQQRTQEAINSYAEKGEKDKLSAALAYAKKNGYTVNVPTTTGNNNGSGASNPVAPQDRADSVRKSFGERLDSYTANGNTGSSSNPMANALLHGLDVTGEDFSGADRYKNIMAFQNKVTPSSLSYDDNQDGVKEGYVKVVQPNGTTSLVSKESLDNSLRNAVPHYNPNGQSYVNTTGQNYAMTDQYGFTHGFDNMKNAQEMSDYYQRLNGFSPLENKNAGQTFEYNGAVNGGYAVDDQGNRVNVGGIEGSTPYMVGNDPKLGEAPTVNGNLGKQVLSSALTGSKNSYATQNTSTPQNSGGMTETMTPQDNSVGAPAGQQIQQGGFQTYVMRNGQKLPATIDAQGKTTLSGGGSLQEGDIVQGRNQQYEVKNGKGVAINNNGLAGALTGGKTDTGKATTVQMPDGSTVNAKIVNGVTYLENGQRPPDGAIVNTGGGKYIMQNGKGVPYNENQYGTQDNGTTFRTKEDVLNAFMEDITKPVDQQAMIKEAAAMLKDYVGDTDTTNAPSWEEALRQSLEMSKDQIAMEDEELEKQINQYNLASGLFGQLPGEVLKRETMLKQKGLQQKAVNDLATSMYNSGIQQQQFNKTYELQKQNQFLEVLNQTIERMTGQRQQNLSNLMAIYNALATQESQAATNAYNQAKLQADIDYNNGKLTLDQYNAQVNAAYKNDSLGIQQQNANSNALRASTYSANAGKGTATQQKTAKEQAIDGFIESKMATYKRPADLYAQLQRGISGVPSGVSNLEIMQRLQEVYPVKYVKMGASQVPDKKNSPFYSDFPKANDTKKQ